MMAGPVPVSQSHLRDDAGPTGADTTASTTPPSVAARAGLGFAPLGDARLRRAALNLQGERVSRDIAMGALIWYFAAN